MAKSSIKKLGLSALEKETLRALLDRLGIDHPKGLAKTRRGRPSKGPRGRFTVRFSDVTCSRIRANAKLRGVTTTDYLGEIVLSALEVK